MKAKRYEHLFLHWVGYIFAILAAVSVGVAKADAIPQPMTVQEAIARTPNNQNFSINVHNNTGTYTQGKTTYSFNIPNPNSNQFGKISTPLSDPLQGGKQLNVAVKDPYGNTARGTINTQTQLPPNSKLNQVAGGYIYGQIAGNIVNSPNAKQAARDLAHGNYGSAAVNAAAAFDAFNVGSGLYGLFDEYQNAKAEIAHSLNTAAKEKSNLAERKYALSEQGKQKAIEDAKANGGYLYSYYLVLNDERPGTHLGVFTNNPFSPAYFTYSNITGELQYQYLGDSSLRKNMPKNIPTRPDITGGYINAWLYSHKLSTDEIDKMQLFVQEPTLEDFLLNEQEIKIAISNALSNILSNQSENAAAIKDLINMLWQNGQLNPSNTQTTVTGSTAENTLLTAPYTPQGSNQAQQTQFIINTDGTMTTSIIPRPDLASNTAQAPTRQIVNHSSSQTQSSEQSQQNEQGNQQVEQHDICKQNPNSLVCAEMQEVDYEDVKVPNEEVKLEFKPADLFVENGICPQPKQIAFYGNTYFLSYEPMCDFATGARPMIILLGIVIAMSMVYATVKEM